MARLLGSKKKIGLLGSFNCKYKINPINYCWEWTASLNNKGYGWFRINEKTKLAHRVSYEFFIGEIPKGIKVCHRCDNPKCCSPFHLFLGTQAENLEDARIKGRRPIITHPSMTSYEYGCRCPECRQIAKEKKQKYKMSKIS